MANLDPTDERPEEATEELEGGAAAAAAYGQPGITVAGTIGSLATGATAEELAAERSETTTDEEFWTGGIEDKAGAADSFAGEGNPHPEPHSDDRGIDASRAMEEQR